MAFFSRQPNENEVTSLEQYYDNQSRSRVLGLLLAFGAVISVALVVTGLFFGGRWAYNRLTDNESPAEKVASVVDSPEQIQVEVGTGTINTKSAEDSTIVPEPTPADKTLPAPTVSLSPSQTPAVTPTPPNPTFTSSTNTDKLPNNGPGDATLIFIAASTVGYFAHIRYSAKKLLNKN